MSIQSTTQKTPIIDKGLDATTIKKLPGPPEFTEELHMRQETDGVLLECYLIYEPEHQATWFKEDQPLLGKLQFSQNSHFWNIILHKIHIFEISILTKLTFLES